MGTCWGAPVENQSTCTTRPPTPGTLENKKISESGESSSNQKGEILEKPKVKVYTFAELKAATKNFRSDAILGEGSFGKVYKGWVDEKTYAPSKPGVGMVVAVKKLKPDGVQGMEEWQSEVNFLGRFSHPNLIKLIGYCRENKKFLLVYEFMQKGSLDNHLFRRGAVVEPLSWSLRLKIALGAARGLAFLHDSQNQVIYRDFKASHILLDGDFNAKLSDFGLAKNGPANGDSHVSTRVVGTSGYAAPEYIATGHLYVKSDVYVFGVVLLEMLTGLRALDRSRTHGQLSLMDWAKPLLSDRKKLLPIMDSRLNEKYPVKGAVQTGQLTQKCLGLDPRSRPSMKEVVEALEQIQSLDEEPKESGSRSKHATGHRNDRNNYVHHRSPLASSKLHPEVRIDQKLKAKTIEDV